MEEDDRRL